MSIDNVIINIGLIFLIGMCLGYLAGYKHANFNKLLIQKTHRHLVVNNFNIVHFLPEQLSLLAEDKLYIHVKLE